MAAAFAALALAQAQARDSGWIADQNGCRVWDPVPAPNESVSWSGACVNGLANGTGVLQWSVNGRPTDRYEGEIRAGHEQGHGVVVSAGGNRYEGEFKDDRKEGHGVEAWANGNRYDGEWKDDRRDGHGIFIAREGDRYEGEWRNDDRNGQGVEVWANGDRYEGPWVHGNPNGHGVLAYANGNRYEGNFKNGNIQGQGADDQGGCALRGRVRARSAERRRNLRQRERCALHGQVGERLLFS